MLVFEMYFFLCGCVDVVFFLFDKVCLIDCDVVFFVILYGVVMVQVLELVVVGVKVIDFVVDFCMQDVVVFEKWYKLLYSCIDLFKEVVYGLFELNCEVICKVCVVGNFGCYLIIMQLGFVFLLKVGVIDVLYLIVDCKFGVFGVGCKVELSLLFLEVLDNFKVYGVFGYCYLFEIIECLLYLISDKVGLLFMLYLVLMICGMYFIFYVCLIKDIDNVVLQVLFEDVYKDEFFVDVLFFGLYFEICIMCVFNMLCLVVYCFDNGDMVVVLVVQDNLVKGVFGQVVQCMNLMFGLDEISGLQQVLVLL